MIAHTADDSLTIYTGLYGDRHGQPLSATRYKTYNPDGHDRSGRPRSRTGRRPVVDTATDADRRPRHDAVDGLLGHRARPAGAHRPADAGAVGAVHPRRLHGRRLLDRQHGARERQRRPARRCSAPTRPRSRSTTPTRPVQGPEIADYIGEAVHCAQGDAICADAQRVKFGQTTPSPSAVTDSLPTEPGGYDGFQALFGAQVRRAAARRGHAER